jgi:mycoredoxin
MPVPATPESVTVYWRPGCPFCSSLRWKLQRLGVDTTEVNIWEDEEARARVRALADGNETVPTVVVAAEVMVNPTARQVREAVERLVPAALRDPALDELRSSRQVRSVGAWVVVPAAVMVSAVTALLGAHLISWAFDAVAVAAALWLAAARLGQWRGNRRTAARASEPGPGN